MTLVGNSVTREYLRVPAFNLKEQGGTKMGTKITNLTEFYLGEIELNEQQVESIKRKTKKVRRFKTATDNKRQREELLKGRL